MRPEQQEPRLAKVDMSMHWALEARQASVVLGGPVVVVVVVVVVEVVVEVVSEHGSKRPRPNNPPQGAAVVVVVVVVVVPHTSLATSEQEGEPHENLNSPQVTSHVWAQDWPVHWSAHAALGSVKRQQTALKKIFFVILSDHQYPPG